MAGSAPRGGTPRGGVQRRKDSSSSVQRRLEQIQSCNVKTKKSKNPEALVESEHEYFLIVAILIYLYHKDDGIFSKEEKKSIKVMINEAKNSISKTTRKELISMLKTDFGENIIIQLVKDYRIKKKMIKKVIKMFEDQFRDERIHLNNLDILEDYILSEY